jgi:hypothetical protein
MRYRVRSEKSRGKMVSITCFSTVRSEDKSVLHDDIPLTLYRWNVQYNRLTEASHTSPSVQTRHICEHVINPDDFSRHDLWDVSNIYDLLTSMNMEVTGKDPKVLDMEIFCVFSSQFWIRRRQYQTRRHVAKIRVTLDEI